MSTKRRSSSNVATPQKQISLQEAFSNSKRARPNPPMTIDTAKTPVLQPQMSDQTKVRKLSIKNLRISGSAGQRDAIYQALFDTLRDAVERILRGEAVTGLQELYNACETLVRGGWTKRCGELQERSMTAAAKQLGETFATQSVGASDLEVCTLLTELLEQFAQRTSLVRCILWYYDRRCMPANKNIDDAATLLFGAEVLHLSDSAKQSDAMFGRFTTALCSLFQRDRDAGIRRGPRHNVLQASVKLSRTVGCFAATCDAYQADLCRATRSLAQQALEDSTRDLGAYLRQTHALDVAESNRLADYWHVKATLASTTVQEEMILKPFEEIAQGVPKLFRDRDAEGFRLLWKYLHEPQEARDAVNQFLTHWSELIKSEGVRLMESDDLVTVLLDFKHDMDTLCKDSFAGDDIVNKRMRDQFASFVNAKGDKLAELVAKYIDSVLRQGNKKFDEQTLEVRMDQLLDMIRFIASKDVFEAFYKKDLAKRLLLNKSASNDAESSLLNKLKIECGASFTQNLEKMFKDIDLSRDFNRTLQLKQLDVMVISQGSWPTYPDVKCKIPEAMQQELERFQALYAKAQTGRKLMWRHTLGHLQIKAHFNAGEKELQVSFFQGLVLLCFNTQKTMTVEALIEATGLEMIELARTLQSLACGRPETRVLLKSPKGKDVLPGDKFMVNASFQNQKRIVRINQIQMKETKEEQDATLDRVEQDRTFEIQAAIVRIMKASKRKTHIDLISSVIDTIKGRGTPKVADIKKSIEKLIDREFLSRQGKEYHYEA